jgi:hypothetical protein
MLTASATVVLLARGHVAFVARPPAAEKAG